MTHDAASMPKVAQMLRHWGCVILTTCGLGHGACAEGVVIGRIGDIELTAADLENPGTLDAAALRQLAEAMLVQRVVLQEALAQQWEQQPETQKLLQKTREAALADSYLKKLCEPPATFPSESEIRAAYEAAKPALQVPRSFRLAQIFVSAERLEAAKTRLQADPSAFAQIARELSEHQPSAQRDGEIGWLTESQIQPEILAQLPKLALNALSEPVKLGDGWHIFKVLDTRAARTPFLEEVRPRLVQQLRAEQTRANMRAYMTKLLQQHPVALDGVALSKLARTPP